jgi:hypothetical protein
LTIASVALAEVSDDPTHGWKPEHGDYDEPCCHANRQLVIRNEDQHRHERPEQDLTQNHHPPPRGGLDGLVGHEVIVPQEVLSLPSRAPDVRSQDVRKGRRAVESQAALAPEAALSGMTLEDTSVAKEEGQTP